MRYKRKISPYRLEKIIREKENRLITNHLLWLYSRTTQKERSQIKSDMNKIKYGN